jgi:uncharacterized protein YprB with RNaseH-like and TPR domain
MERSFRFGDIYGRSPLANPNEMEVMRRFGADGEVIFLDLETTGLSGGAGTYAFLCGLGRTRGETFSVTQYFLKNPAHEPEWLRAIDDDIPRGAALVTYNGRAFDAPMLLTRHVLARMDAHWESSPHIDLLYFSRRLYRGRLDSCSLGSVERHVLGLRRSGEDVPGSLIPAMYAQYLRTGDASELGGVFYHNVFDIASLASFYCHAARVMEGASGDGRELLRAGDFWRDRGCADEAERLWTMAAGDPAARVGSLMRMAFLAKKARDHAGARERFELALNEMRTSRSGWTMNELLTALEELAKLEEHRFASPGRALDYVRTALDALRRARYYGGSPDAEMFRAMEHRRARLTKKIFWDGADGEDGRV